jgi:hypothetical protein
MSRFPNRHAITARPARLGVAHALASVAVLFVALSPAAFAATDDDLRELRDQLRQLKEQYEKRIGALEERLQAAERTATHAGAEASKAASQASAIAAAPVAQPAARQTGESAMNPAISLTLNGTLGNLSRDPSSYNIGGFVPTGGEVAPPARGISLGESELSIASNIDQHFRGELHAALTPENTVSVEEANIRTIGLSNGFTVKAGRFFSGIGYLNEIHAHAWDFVDAPLANKVFLGGQLGDDGVQVKWVAPTDLYIDVGIEAGRGRSFPAAPAGGRSKNGFGTGTLFTNVGGDIGESTAWKVGLSQLRAQPEGRTYTDADSTGTNITNSFSGASRLWVLGGVLKWSPNGNSTQTSFKLQGEYFKRNEDGQLTYDTASASLGARTGSYRSRQSGWYLQGIYQFMPEWRAGYRYDRLDAGTTAIGLVDSGVLAGTNFPLLAGYTPIRNSLMVDWSGSEFSRLRLQLSRDRARAGVADNQLFLQYIVNLGAHGAHQF